MSEYRISFTPIPSTHAPIETGAVANGDEIGSTAHHLIRGGAPWYPVMGEFHFSRYPAEGWELELRKMKACGIGIVATYVFWLYHEEEKGVWRTDGDLDLRRFVTLCQKVGLEVLLRIGPWAHGECRNGGFPDWLQHDESIKKRSDDPKYIELVKMLYANIFDAVRGLLYADGGPVIGIQLENEYGHAGGLHGEAGLNHMRTLKRLAVEAGFCVPIYTATGWGGGNVVGGEMLPVMGGYADAPWDRSLGELPANANFLMLPAPNDPLIASDFTQWDHFDKRFTFDTDAYPYLTAELGGGIQCTFHRRPLISARDTLAQALCKLGTGANLLGYYMFHGGTHPLGLCGTTQESRATGSYTDVPRRSYDFQAPIGEYGALHESYGALKALHLFVNDCGESLAESMCYFPENAVKDAENMADLRYSVRYSEANDEGFLFINNHQRLRSMSAHGDARITVKCGEREYALPPIAVPSGACAAIPFNLRCGEHRLLTTNCQLLCRLDGVPVLWSWNGDAPISIFDSPDAKAIFLSKKEAENAWLTSGELYICEGCLLGTPEGLTVISERTRETVKRVRDGAIFKLTAEEVTAEVGYEATHKTEAYAEYTVRIGDFDKDKIDDMLLNVAFTGDHAEIWIGDTLAADWYTTGQAWRPSLARFGHPSELTVRVFPVENPTYFEIPTPVGMTLDSVTASAQYRMTLSQNCAE